MSANARRLLCLWDLSNDKGFVLCSDVSLFGIKGPNCTIPGISDGVGDFEPRPVNLSR